MSISSMASAAVGRRPDYPPLSRSPQNLTEVSIAAGGSTAPNNQVTSALNVIVAYIPTEILTLYVAVLAALGSPGPAKKVTLGMVIAFWAFLACTPLTVWLLYAVKVVSGGKQLPASPPQWPVWEMIAGTIAYAVWAFAMPNNPFAGTGWYSSAIAGVVVLVVSTLIGLVSPLFQKQLST